jgi:manganese/zinc/iron transport system substrate-binding protein
MLLRICLFAVLSCVAFPVWAQKPIEAVTTIGQISDIVANVGKERVRVQGLMGAGVDPHLYRASESDVSKLSKADIIFYNGLHLEAKMGEIFERMGKTRTVIAVSERITEGELLADAVYPDIHDPHIWFDVTLWIKAVERVQEALSAKDPEGKDF